MGEIFHVKITKLGGDGSRFRNVPLVAQQFASIFRLPNEQDLVFCLGSTNPWS
jgi:hypothetical protein